MTQKLYIGLIFSFLSLIAKAQTTAISGLITDQQHQPIASVSVTVKSLSQGAISDPNGHFRIDHLLNGRYILIFSKVGYRTVSKTVVAERDINDLKIVLATDQRSLKEVEVSGITSAQAEAGAIKKSVVPVTILSSKEIENRASNLNEMLARQAGVQIRQTGGLGSETRISVRGLEGKRVQIFIEGNPLNSPDGSFGINDIPLQLIERIEIYKGTVPAWLGGDGLGGAVNIVMKHRDISYLDVNLSQESYQTTQASLLGKKTFDKAGIEAGLGLIYAHAANNYVMDSPFEPGLKIKRDHDQYTSAIAGGNIKFHHLWFDEAELEAIYTYNYKQLQGIQRNIRFVDTRSNARVLNINLRKERFFSEKLDFRYNLMYAGFDGKYTDTSAYMYNFDGSRYPSTLGHGEIGIGPNLTTTLQHELRHRLNLNYRVYRDWSVNLNNTMRLSNNTPNDDVAN